MRATRLVATGHEVEGFLLQPQLEHGVELLIGAVRDPQFGTVVACGAGGTAVELLDDTSIRLAPVGRHDAQEMLEEFTTYPLLTGFRGAPKVDVDAAADALCRLASLAELHPTLAEIEWNPVTVTPDGVFVVDSRARLAMAQQDFPVGAKRSSSQLPCPRRRTRHAEQARLSPGSGGGIGPGPPTRRLAAGLSSPGPRLRRGRS
jgi:hypothetical protein